MEPTKCECGLMVKIGNEGGRLAHIRGKIHDTYHKIQRYYSRWKDNL